jgi:hypothetical protein
MSIYMILHYDRQKNYNFKIIQISNNSNKNKNENVGTDYVTSQ